jgi:hypothetical protein
LAVLADSWDSTSPAPAAADLIVLKAPWALRQSASASPQRSIADDKDPMLCCRHGHIQKTRLDRRPFRRSGVIVVPAGHEDQYAFFLALERMHGADSIAASLPELFLRRPAPVAAGFPIESMQTRRCALPGDRDARIVAGISRCRTDAMRCSRSSIQKLL